MKRVVIVATGSDGVEGRDFADEGPGLGLPDRPSKQGGLVRRVPRMALIISLTVLLAVPLSGGPLVPTTVSLPGRTLSATQAANVRAAAQLVDAMRRCLAEHGNLDGDIVSTRIDTIPDMMTRGAVQTFTATAQSGQFAAVTTKGEDPTQSRDDETWFNDSVLVDAELSPIQLAILASTLFHESTHAAQHRGMNLKLQESEGWRMQRLVLECALEADILERFVPPPGEDVPAEVRDMVRTVRDRRRHLVRTALEDEAIPQVDDWILYFERRAAAQSLTPRFQDGAFAIAMEEVVHPGDRNTVFAVNSLRDEVRVRNHYFHQNEVVPLSVVRHPMALAMMVPASARAVPVAIGGRQVFGTNPHLPEGLLLVLGTNDEGIPSIEALSVRIDHPDGGIETEENLITSNGDDPPIRVPTRAVAESPGRALGFIQGISPASIATDDETGRIFVLDGPRGDVIVISAGMVYLYATSAEFPALRSAEQIRFGTVGTIQRTLIASPYPPGSDHVSVNSEVWALPDMDGDLTADGVVPFNVRERVRFSPHLFIPAMAGDRVLLVQGSFESSIQVLDEQGIVLGTREIQFREPTGISLSRQLALGEHVVLRNATSGEATEPSIVRGPEPVIVSVSDYFVSARGIPGQISIRGRHFPDNAIVCLNHRTVQTWVISRDEIRFSVPAIAEEPWPTHPELPRHLPVEVRSAGRLILRFEVLFYRHEIFVRMAESRRNIPSSEAGPANGEFHRP